jgi:recombination protein RecA
MAVKGKGFDNKGEALDSALFQIEKQFGKGSIMKLGDKDMVVNLPVVSTGSITLDAAVGIGGVPKGRVIEIYGPESSGKTTLALHIVAESQKQSGVAAYIDAEHALDLNYARKLGVKVDEILLSQPDCGEDALEIAEILVRSNAVDVIVIDSVAALVPKAELEGQMEDSQIGLQARLMSKALRKLTALVNKTNTILIFINQIRMKINTMGFGANPETTTGGNALKFYASVRLDIRKIATLKKGNEPVGGRTRVKVVKNKVAPPFQIAEFDIIYGQGINRLGEIIDIGVNNNIIKRVGAWYSYGDERLGQGRDNAIDTLKNNPELLKEIQEKVFYELGLKKQETEENITKNE